eukprot:jgi/Mesen1/9921/ME000070S09208
MRVLAHALPRVPVCVCVLEETARNGAQKLHRGIGLCYTCLRSEWAKSAVGTTLARHRTLLLCAPVCLSSQCDALVLLTGGLLSLSEQQVLDCQGRDKCAGGWPSDALEYAANTTKPSGGLALDSTYKYAGSARACSAAQAKQGRAGVAMWEEVNFIGWFGLLLAVQNQPLVVSVAASSPSFVSYVKVCMRMIDWAGMHARVGYCLYLYSSKYACMSSDIRCYTGTFGCTRIYRTYT